MLVAAAAVVMALAAAVKLVVVMAEDLVVLVETLQPIQVLAVAVAVLELHQGRAVQA